MDQTRLSTEHQVNRLPDRIVLVGPSGSGKSELSRLLAETLGFEVVDTDDEIVRRVGMPIATFFERFGEPPFRAIESGVVAEACARRNVVIATGGGAVLDHANWTVWRPGSVIVGLMAKPEVLAARVRAQTLRDGVSAGRPLLAGNAEERIRAQLAVRSAFYATADVTIHTDSLSPEEICAEAARVVRQRCARGMVPALSLGTPAGRSDIYIGRGGREALGAIVRQRWPGSRRVWCISDEHVAAAWGQEARELFSNAGFEAKLLVVAAGESSKRMAEVERLCREMTCGGVTRQDVVVALGGGVVGDLAGFVASVCLRGLPLAQAPTSLLAMVDSSVGGKTGVNMPAGKNLVGSFYQPGVVVIDPDLLSTLPRAEYRSGMAEVIKHSLIQSSTPLGGNELARLLEDRPLDPLPDDVLEHALALNVAIKHSVVRADERESGLRMILNFGHTAGHAIEADGFRYRHGEAVAIGLVVASHVAVALGRVDGAYVERLERLLVAAGLPVRYQGSADSAIARMAGDKKKLDGTVRWILPRADGRVEAASNVPEAVVRGALASVGATY